MTNTSKNALAESILLHAATHAMRAFIQALAERGESYVALYAADDGESIVAALRASEKDLTIAVAAEMMVGQAGLSGTDVAPRIRDRAAEHGARVAAQYLIDRGRVVS